MDTNVETKSATHSQSAAGQPKPDSLDTGQPDEAQPAPEQSTSTQCDSSQLDTSLLDTGQPDTHQLDQWDLRQPNDSQSGTDELLIAQSNTQQILSAQVEHSTLKSMQPYTEQVRQNQQQDTSERSDASIAFSDVPHITAELHIVTKGLSLFISVKYVMFYSRVRKSCYCELIV